MRVVGVRRHLLGWHADEGAGGRWSSKSGVEGVVEVGDLGDVSVPVLRWRHNRVDEEQKVEVDHIHLSASLTFQPPALPAVRSIPGVRCCNNRFLAPSWDTGLLLRGMSR